MSNSLMCKRHSVISLLILSLVLMVLMLVVPISTQAEDVPTLTISSGTGQPGETVDITIALSERQGIAGIQYVINFDKDVFFVEDTADTDEDGYPDGIEFNSTTPNFPISEVTVFNSSGRVSFAQVRAGGSPFTSSGSCTLVSIHLQIKDSAINGTYNITASNGLTTDGGNPAVEIELTAPTPGQITVTGGNEPPSSEKAITSFVFEAGDNPVLSSDVTAAINEDNHTITAELPAATDRSSLVPAIEVSEGANVSPASGVGQDFNTPVNYSVTAADSSQQVYFVTVSLATPTVPQLLSAQVNNSGNVELTLDKAMANPGASPAGFSLSRYDEDSDASVINSVQLKSGDPTVVQIIPNKKITGGYTGEYGYTASYTPGSIASVDGGLLEGFEDFAVVNTLPYPELMPNTFSEYDEGSSISDIDFVDLTNGNGSPPYIYYLYSGTLPTGTTLETAGPLTGIPNQKGTYNFAIQVIDSQGAVDIQTYSLTILGEPVPAVSYASVNGDGTLAIQYDRAVTNVTGNELAFTISDTKINNDWLVTSISSPTSSSIILTTTEKLVGGLDYVLSYDSTVGAISGAYGTKVPSFTVDVDNDLPHPTQQSATLSNGEVGVDFDYDFSALASGGTGPYTYQLSPADSVPGLTLNANGLMTGVPTTAGTFTFDLWVYDQNGAFASRENTLVIDSANEPIPIAAVVTAEGNVELTMNRPMADPSNQLSFFSVVSEPSHTWVIDTVQAGSTAGKIILTMTDKLKGGYAYELQYQNGTWTSQAGVSVKPFELEITNELPHPILTDLTPPDSEIGIFYEGFTFGATGGTGDYAYSIIIGSLPPGLAMANGVISGTPTALGAYSFTLMVTDSIGAIDVESYTIKINPQALSLSVTNPPHGQVGTAYN